MQSATFEEGLDQITTRDPRYHRDAYLFLREALDYTQKAILKSNRGKLRHITGQELLNGVREYALAEYGPMAITVLNEWGIRRCEDFGDLVFNMVEARLLAKTDQDSPDDFKSGYDFQEAFRDPFLPSHKRRKVDIKPLVN